MILTQAFHNQARSCTALGSPFMGRLLTLLAETWDERTALGRYFASFSGDLGPAGHSLPLRLCGGLHALVLTDRDTGLAAVYPPHTPTDAAFAQTVAAALQTHETFLIDWCHSPPQTNEIRRSAALIPMAHVACTRFDLPVMLSELGASGGLNLIWDRYSIDADGTRLGAEDAVVTFGPEWTGPLPQDARPVIAARRGVDLNPLDPRRPDDLLRLLAYLWPDQPERLEMTRKAAAEASAQVDQSDAIDWLDTRLAAQPEGQLHLIQNTVAWQYFPAEVQARGLQLIETAGQRATASRPLGWMQMETDGDTGGQRGAALTLRLWPGDIRLDLGRADFHGRWIDWRAP